MPEPVIPSYEDELITSGSDVPTVATCDQCELERPPFALYRRGEAIVCGEHLVEDHRKADQAHKLNLDDVRAMRAARLAQTDWTQLDDVPLATRAKWKPYRQALRDLPQNAPPDLKNLVWPEPPA